MPFNLQTELQNSSTPTTSPLQRLVIGVVALLGVVATLMLGQWQLARGDQKVQIQEQLTKQMSLPALEQQEFIGLSEAEKSAYLNRRINLNGQWIESMTIYLANRSHAGRFGFWVMTPLRVNTSDVVMVERGWVAWNPANPSEKPVSVQTPLGRVNIEALVVEPPSKMLELWGATASASASASASATTSTEREGAADAQAPSSQNYTASAIWQNFDLNLFEAQTGIQLRAVVHQLGAPSEGLVRELPAQGVSADRNFGYAVQWFLLSALIAVLYLWFQWIKPRIHARKL
jgi:cytochrome oxidase assembly protein ShyY1